MSSAASAVSSIDAEALTTSAIVAEAATGSHLLEIKGYSLTKGLGNGKFVRSSTFSAAGHSWNIRYYPDGENSDCAEWISIFLQRGDHAEDAVDDVKAQFEFSVLDNIGEPVPKFKHASSMQTFAAKSLLPWGFGKFVERKALEESACVKDDRLRVRCDITVKKDVRAEASTQFVVVPASDMHQHFGRLLSDAERTTDVTFEVAGETFPAHRCVLAARSSVFMAELFGPMKEKGMNCIRIDGMEARVFKAMLHFIYTDTVPEIIAKDDAFVMAQHLLVAADRYDLERLKRICEEKLCIGVDASTVATILALAEQHSCHGLKKACFELLESPTHLKTAMATDGFDHLMSSSPALVKELLAKIAACP